MKNPGGSSFAAGRLTHRAACLQFVHAGVKLHQSRSEHKLSVLQGPSLTGCGKQGLRQVGAPSPVRVTGSAALRAHLRCTAACGLRASRAVDELSLPTKTCARTPSVTQWSKEGQAIVHVVPFIYSG